MWRPATDLALFKELLMIVVMQAVVKAGMNPEYSTEGGIILG
jgi:hypothetical protein